MSKKSVSDLSRETGVSRVTIYSYMKKLNIVKRPGDFTDEEWELLQENLVKPAKINENKTAAALEVCKGLESESVKVYNPVRLKDIDISTLNERLSMAKQEYDYNRDLILAFQAEADQYKKENGTTTMVTHNGSVGTIPSIVNLEKYIKLNITLSKLISDLEKELNLGDDDIENPFT